MAIGEALGGIIGGFLGKNAAANDLKNQKKLMQQAIAEYTKLGYPPDYSKALVLQEYERAGVLTPELEQEVEIAASEMGQLTEDQSVRDTQKQALEMLKTRAKVGLSAEDRAALNEVRGQTQRDSEAKRQQILQQMQARGMGGSGSELMAQLQSAQGAADQAASGSDEIMAQAQQRALQALSESSRAAGDLRGQDFNVNSARAQALDERNKMLAQNSVARQSANVGRLNQAQQYNLSEQQRVNDANVGLSNAEKQRQAQAQADLYAQKLQYTAGKTGQIRDNADFRGQQAQQKFNQSVAMGKGVGGLADSGLKEAGGFAGVASMFSDENLKNDIDYSDDEVISWMDRIAKRLKAPKE
jgi:hypothetical protein